MFATMVQIAAVIVTYRRDPELARLLRSLEKSSSRPSLVVVVDHAAARTTSDLVRQSDLRVFYEASPENPGPGAGWKRGMQIALQEQPAITHFLVLDDDVVLSPEAIVRLAVATEKAAMACPMLVDSQDNIWAFPEPLDKPLRKIIRQVHSRQESINRLGQNPLPFVWCTGACVMIRCDAVKAVGFHRTDFWMLGEDLEYSMRMVAYGGGVFLPDLFVQHLPPPEVSNAAAAEANQRKFDSLLQNLTYLSFHHPHSGHMMSYLPGNVRRYLKTFGWKISSLRHLISCLWNGAVRKVPAGVKER